MNMNDECTQQQHTNNHGIYEMAGRKVALEVSSGKEQKINRTDSRPSSTTYLLIFTFRLLHNIIITVTVPLSRLLQ